MPEPLLAPSRRIRTTPFTRRVEAAGVRAYSVYNHMLLPAVFESQAADAAHLKAHVQVWDVSCQRQVELSGPHAHALLQRATPRDLARMEAGRCRYLPMVDERGGMLNDPVALKLAAERYWVSVADSDLLFWLKGLANGLGLDVRVDEPAVYPLAVQGPKADTLAARVFGEEVRAIRFFRYAWLPFRDRELLVARSGYSKQGGFEIYLDVPELAEPLWDALMDAGADLTVRAGGPNTLERIEGGLLSYGNDMTRANTPAECGLDRLYDPQTAVSCIGIDALRREAETGPRQRVRGLRIDGGPAPACRDRWPATAHGAHVGGVTSVACSPERGTNVAIGMLDRDHWAPGTAVEVAAPDGPRPATVVSLPHT